MQPQGSPSRAKPVLFKKPPISRFLENRRPVRRGDVGRPRCFAAIESGDGVKLGPVLENGNRVPYVCVRVGEITHVEMVSPVAVCTRPSGVRRCSCSRRRKPLGRDQAIEFQCYYSGSGTGKYSYIEGIRSFSFMVGLQKNALGEFPLASINDTDLPVYDVYLMLRSHVDLPLDTTEHQAQAFHLPFATLTATREKGRDKPRAGWREWA